MLETTYFNSSPLGKEVKQEKRFKDEKERRKMRKREEEKRRKKSGE